MTIKPTSRQSLTSRAYCRIATAGHNKLSLRTYLGIIKTTLLVSVHSKLCQIIASSQLLDFASFSDGWTAKGLCKSPLKVGGDGVIVARLA